MQKLFITLSLTGIGYGATLAYTYFVLAYATDESISRLNQYESVLTIIASLISLGVVQDASRNITLNAKEWRSIYCDAQGLRLSLAILISIGSLLAYMATKSELYLLGLASFSMALSGEYALYALGRPVEGSLASLIRALLFSAIIILFSIYKGTDFNSITITIAWSLGFFACGLFASKKLDVTYLLMPRSTQIKTLKTIGLLALLIFIYNNLKPSFILMISDKISLKENAYYFEAYKIYFILFSVRRVVVQALYKEIITSPKSLKYDFIVSCVMAVALVGLWFARTIIDMASIKFPGLSYQILIDISIITAMSCILPTSFTRLFSLKKDLLIVIPVLCASALLFVGIKTLSLQGASVSSYLYLLGAAELVISLTSFLILKRKLATT